MALIVMLLMYAIGLILGFAWGLDTALHRPAYAMGFLRGFWAPWRWVKSLWKKEK